MMMNTIDGLRGISWKMLSATGLSPPEIEKLVAEALSEIVKRDNHPYTWL